MPRIKIIKDYQPKEGWKIGDVVDVSNAEALVKEGNAILIADNGDEIEHPDILIQMRRLVKSIQGMELVNSLITKHPEKEMIVKILTDEGSINPIREEAKVVKEVKAELPKIEDLPVRPSVNVTKEEIMAKVEELKKKN